MISLPIKLANRELLITALKSLGGTVDATLDGCLYIKTVDGFHYKISSDGEASVLNSRIALVDAIENVKKAYAMKVLEKVAKKHELYVTQKKHEIVFRTYRGRAGRDGARLLAEVHKDGSIKFTRANNAAWSSETINAFIDETVELLGDNWHMPPPAVDEIVWFHSKAIVPQFHDV